MLTQQLVDIPKDIIQATLDILQILGKNRRCEGKILADSYDMLERYDTICIDITYTKFSLLFLNILNWHRLDFWLIYLFISNLYIYTIYLLYMCICIHVGIVVRVKAVTAGSTSSSTATTAAVATKESNLLFTLNYHAKSSDIGI